MNTSTTRLLQLALILGVVGVVVFLTLNGGSPDGETGRGEPNPNLNYKPRQQGELSGFGLLSSTMPPWGDGTSLEQIRDAFQNLGYKGVENLDRTRDSQSLTGKQHAEILLLRASFLCYEGKPREAYQNLEEARGKLDDDPVGAEEWLYTFIFFQGVTGLRIGEDENCIMCRGESSCIVPIAPSAVHQKSYGSKLAIKHFTEYLEKFPDDYSVRWLLALAHMTLGEYPGGVDPRFALNLDPFFKSEFDIGRFRDVGHLVGVNRYNQAGGAIMDDFDNDGLLDIVVSTMDSSGTMSFYRNKGDGTFEDATAGSGLDKQLGGLNIVQADYDGDGNVDIFVLRGAWMMHPMRPSLLRNDGKGHFTDVTKEAGVLAPVNTIAAAWGDYDNDGKLDLFVCCERQPNKLYRNKGDGTFEEVASFAGVAGDGRIHCKSAQWIDFDNDGWQDLFLNNMAGRPQLFQNQRNGKFVDVAFSMGITGPEKMGFACWACDYDNDGFTDIFATSYDRTLDTAVRGMMGLPHDSVPSRLYRNIEGKRFEDVTKQVGLDKPYVTMGSNFADVDGDGFIDFYLGTGDPCISTLIPNRMLKNVGGKRFADISASSGMANLQKGHGVACGDWNRDGQVDVFIQMGGATHGDKYHNIMFQNPGHDHQWIALKLIGTKSNRSALGARIKITTAGKTPMTIHRTVSSGGSFGANALEQTIGLGKADKIESLEITWPTSGIKQVFKNVAIDQMLEISEAAADFKKLPHKRIALPDEAPAKK